MVEHYKHIKSQEKKTYVAREGQLDCGLFAGEHIKTGEYIIEYVGELVDEAEYQRRFNHYKSFLGLVARYNKMQQSLVIMADLPATPVIQMQDSSMYSCIFRSTMSSSFRLYGKSRKTSP